MPFLAVTGNVCIQVAVGSDANGLFIDMIKHALLVMPGKRQQR
jgi:hypothetical protein